MAALPFSAIPVLDDFRAQKVRKMSSWDKRFQKTVVSSILGVEKRASWSFQSIKLWNLNRKFGNLLLQNSLQKCYKKNRSGEVAGDYLGTVKSDENFLTCMLSKVKLSLNNSFTQVYKTIFAERRKRLQFCVLTILMNFSYTYQNVPILVFIIRISVILLWWLHPFL